MTFSSLFHRLSVLRMNDREGVRWLTAACFTVMIIFCCHPSSALNAEEIKPVDVVINLDDIKLLPVDVGPVSVKTSHEFYCKSYVVGADGTKLGVLLVPNACGTAEITVASKQSLKVYRVQVTTKGSVALPAEETTVTPIDLKIGNRKFYQFPAEPIHALCTSTCVCRTTLLGNSSTKRGLEFSGESTGVSFVSVVTLTDIMLYKIDVTAPAPNAAK